jgi:C-terminal processing protease CtpA/Prc
LNSAPAGISRNEGLLIVTRISIALVRPALLAAVIALAALLLPASGWWVSAQDLEDLDRDTAKAMLRAARQDIKQNYYDPSLHGINLEAHFKQAAAKLKQATTREQLVFIVAQTLLDLNDSHTFLLPPLGASQVEYGWQMKLAGDRAFIHAVKPGSDAEMTGFKVGDEILAVDGSHPTRANIWQLNYRYYALMPAVSIRLAVQSPGEDHPRELIVRGKILPSAKLTDWNKFIVGHERGDLARDRFVEFDKQLLVWQMPTFSVSEAHIDEMAGKARNFQSLVIDLRGNSGGSGKALERLAGHFFDHDVKISDEKGRKETRQMIARSRGSGGFKGKLFVLVDSESASASEVFARLMQIEKRGTIIGDRTAGAVMVAKHFGHLAGTGKVLYFGTSVTVADLIMSDGQSLENRGVIPDVLLIPAGADLAARRDPALAHAAKLAGVILEPEKAGQFFPTQWREE